MTENLILTPFRKALASLEEVIAQPKNDFIRDATIQRFEYTYELAWKMIKRHLDWAGFSDTAALSRKDLFREAAKIGLIPDPERWFDYNRARNESSHAYNQEIAEDVYKIARDFLPDAAALLAALRGHHD